ncbi:uncharacterized protein LOC115607976 isoform X2 [Strigops habroptila]|uniref:uncharacterized protein LOC115607976 isoform X2 n=1 Tax=Strigops habroptila TaxID=2489341 RepID=UPI0011CFDF40|nr:uncharacterized protein LOC115607976 isoform X2 [Strigops habroptila]
MRFPDLKEVDHCLRYHALLLPVSRRWTPKQSGLILSARLATRLEDTEKLQTLDMEKVMVETNLTPWEILLVIFAAVLIMSFLMFLPPAAVVIWRMKHVPQISLHGSV